ncbi:restriction endonuclease subunit S [Endozoicomonas acroporae]|uniref:restriction endonuclease subunit S n=1 Tax=Endozoicomonas acroporae TaxID=1701104 RepID=UPI0015E112AB|nr:restriction endonuclease subunit S [Endozoicomonas acroporae]
MFEIKPLRVLVEKQTGGGTPSRHESVFWNGDIPWASVKDFNDNELKISCTEESITEKGLQSSASNLIPSGVPLVCTRMAVGRTAITTCPMAINQDVKALFPADGVHAGYLLRLLKFIQIKADEQSIGSTVKGIRIQDYLDIPVPVAPENEQPIIDHYLEILDTNTRQTEAIIAKLQQVKKGLLHDLLTRGIDDSGQLRPPQHLAPELYKDSPLGWIPKEWKISTLTEICSDIVDCPHSTPVYQDEGVLVARTMHIKEGQFLENLASKVSEASYKKRILRLEPQEGDVIFTREAPVGEAFVIPANMKVCLGQRVMILRPKTDSLCGEFLVAQIYSGQIKDRIKMLTAGTTNPHLNVAEVRNFLMPSPALAEQKNISSRINALNLKIRLEIVRFNKLKKQKSGLMNDLLTGKVRVTSLL